VGAADDGDADPGAVDALPVEGAEVVDGGEIPRRQVVPGREGRGEARVLGGAGQVVQGDFLVVNVSYGLFKLTLEV
jgi:hypothetical protein